MDGRRRRRRSLIVSVIAVVWSAALLTIVALLYKQGAQKASIGPGTCACTVRTGCWHRTQQMSGGVSRHFQH